MACEHLAVVSNSSEELWEGRGICFSESHTITHQQVVHQMNGSGLWHQQQQQQTSR